MNCNYTNKQVIEFCVKYTFSHMVAAYDTASPEMKALIEKLDRIIRSFPSFDTK